MVQPLSEQVRISLHSPGKANNLGIIEKPNKFLSNMGGSIRINPVGVTVLALVFVLLLFLRFRPSHNELSAERGGLLSMKQLLSVSIEAAKRGGNEVKRVREAADIGEKSKGKTREGANNPVTDGDMLSHRAMFYTILKAFPNVNVISEEEHDSKPVDMNEIKFPPLSNKEVQDIALDDMLVPINEIDVWIDPLDATQEYTESLLHYVTTMVCVAVRGKPVMGVIYKPFDDVTAWGWAGPNYVSKVVSKDVETNKPKEHHDLSQSHIIVSRSHAGNVHTVAKETFGPSVNVTPAGGAGYKSWEVMKGTQDAYVHVTLIKKWDICAGNAILRALGGKLTTLMGEEVNYSGRPAHELNEGGVLATMHDHDKYLDVLKVALDDKANKGR